MASRTVNRGLQVFGGVAFATADGFAAIQTMSVDDSTVAFAAGDTALNTGGAVANEADRAFDSLPTRSGQQFTVVATFAATEANFLMRRIAFHNAAAASVTTSSVTLVLGVDGQSLQGTSDFTKQITVVVQVNHQ